MTKFGIISTEIDLAQEMSNQTVKFPEAFSKESIKLKEQMKVTELDEALKDVLKKADKFNKVKSFSKRDKKSNIKIDIQDQNMRNMHIRTVSEFMPTLPKITNRSKVDSLATQNILFKSPRRSEMEGS